jgi:hypothetical protein
MKSEETSARVKLLRDAALTVSGDRDATYGGPEDSFAAIAELWNIYLRRRPNAPLEPYDVAAMMMLFKTARLIANPTHRDSLLDIAGYAACYEECIHTKRT